MLLSASTERCVSCLFTNLRDKERKTTPVSACILSLHEETKSLSKRSKQLTIQWNPELPLMMDHTIYQKQHHTAFLCIQHSGHRSGYKATNIPQSQEDTYMRPQSECLAMFFNVKAAVSRMCLVTGPSFSSWERKQTRIIFSRSGSWKRALVLDIWAYRDDNYNDNQCEHPHCWMISFCKIVVQSTCCLSSCDT